MSWIVLASFICGALALVYSLHASGLEFNRIGDGRNVLNLFCAEFKDSLQFIARRNKVWLALAGTVSLLLLLTREYVAFFAIAAGAIAPIFVGSLAAAMRIALGERCTDPDLETIQYKSQFLSGQMVIGCGLIGNATILCLALLADLGRRGAGTSILVYFTFGVCAGVVLFLRTFSAKTGSPTDGTAARTEGGPHPERAEAEPKTAAGWRAASWDTFIYGNFIITFVAAAVIAREVCGVTSQAVQMPLLIGTVGLMACLSASWLIVDRHWHRLSLFQVRYNLTIRGALVLAAAALLLLGEHLHIDPLFDPLYRGKDANLLPSALVGIVLSGLMILVSDVCAWQYPAESQDLGMRLTGTGTGIIRRAMVATFMTASPFLVALVSFFAGYHLIERTGLSPSVGILGIAMTVVSSISVSGISGVFESEDRHRALRKFYGTGTLTLTGLCLFTSYTVAISELHNKNLPFDLSNPKILLGLLVGGLIPYMLVALLAVGIVKGVGSLVREIAFRYRSMQ
jgi:K(+)-stimulated pyrophosphate-energized sodium pump